MNKQQPISRWKGIASTPHPKISSEKSIEHFAEEGNRARAKNFCGSCTIRVKSSKDKKI